MVESWIIGLIAVVVAAPVAVASYVSAVRSSRAEGPAEAAGAPVQLAGDGRPAGRTSAVDQRHPRRRIAA